MTFSLRFAAVHYLSATPNDADGVQWHITVPIRLCLGPHSREFTRSSIGLAVAMAEGSGGHDWGRQWPRRNVADRQMMAAIRLTSTTKSAGKQLGRLVAQINKAGVRQASRNS